MAKNQERWRDALDFIYAPAQFLQHDGAIHKTSTLGKIFAKASKPEYPFIYLFSLMAAQGYPLGGAILGTALSVMASSTVRISNFLNHLIPVKSDVDLKGLYFDTEGEIKSYIKPELKEKLEMAKDFGKIRTGLFLAAPLISYPVTREIVQMDGVDPSSQGLSVLTGGTLALFWGIAVKSGGEYWRARQVLDGNWSAFDPATLDQ